LTGLDGDLTPMPATDYLCSVPVAVSISEDLACRVLPVDVEPDVAHN